MRIGKMTRFFHKRKEKYMKQKVDFTLKLDAALLEKAEALAQIEGQSTNNMIAGLIRSAVAYHERVHGKIDTSSAKKI